ncbi:MAG TPA: SpoIIE family protein phosphatase [Isosphaeraceae bacterium]|nr:SpoIIE family protein phosphatase [Isosphaeraceae bacterium]
MSTEPVLTEHKVTVLLIDDQPMIGEAVRRMLAGEPDIIFHYCRDASKALQEAGRLKPTVILQDLVMPDIDGLTLVKMVRANDPTRETPMIMLSTKEEPMVKAEAFALGANDYIVKLPDRIELLARIRYHSKGYINLLQRNEAYEALLESQRRLANEMRQAEHYVRSLLPEKLKKGPIRTEWRFIPSAELGGDSFGYHWLDDDHFAFYLLDVSGHGVGSALLSVSAMNALRSQALPQTDFRLPGRVLGALNNAFQMDQQNGLFFTIWYGVYHKPTRRIDYAGGGHPPGLLFNGPSSEQVKLEILEANGPMIGAVPDIEYQASRISLDSFARLYIYSDGAYEIERTDKTMWPFSEFLDFMNQGAHSAGSDSQMDHLIAHDRKLQGREEFVDDFSIVELQFV